MPSGVVTMKQENLFDRPTDRAEVAVSEGTLPPGLVFIPNFVSLDDEREIIQVLDDPSYASWSTELSRRVQHFGYRYNYKLRALSAEDRTTDLPEPLRWLAEELVSMEYFSKTPDQVIVNEYEPGQGISPHVDRETCFGPVVASLSLGSDAVLDFRSSAGQSGSLLLRARSMVVLSEDARYRWQHGIVGRKRDKIGGLEFSRERRVSLTFRSVLISQSA
jgi:alkylated DNA repair dioxygenase AlkB